MIAEMLANLLHARSAGRSRWLARCPAHNDRSPSLSIREGRDGRTLIRCWAGCGLPDVLQAAGLKMSDLFDGPPPSPAAARQAAQEREEREAHEALLRQADRAERNRVRRLEAVCNALGARLARLPDSDPRGVEMTRLFHQVSDRLHAAQVKLAVRP